VVYGMTIAIIVGLFIIAVSYVFVQRLSERGKPPAKVASSTPASEGTHGGTHS